MEFSLIDQFFKTLPNLRGDVLLGIGDDAACLALPQGQTLLVSTDTLVSGVHFLPEWSAYDIAYKSVMANISDIAAMAAVPSWITLALTLPVVDNTWLDGFSRGLHDSLSQFNVSLVGGDTTKGPLSITLTIMGYCSYDKVVKRSGAKVGDIIFVSGPIGGAALAVKYLNKSMNLVHRNELMDKLLHPKPRVDLRDLLQNYANSAIDISDGLSADLNHICVESGGLGACLRQKDIPVHHLLEQYLGEHAMAFALTGGDDYELCFTVAAEKVDAFITEAQRHNIGCYSIGVIQSEPGLRIDTGTQYEPFVPKGYSHF